MRSVYNSSWRQEVPAPSSQKVHVSQSGLGAGSVPAQTAEVSPHLVLTLPAHGHSEPASSGEANLGNLLMVHLRDSWGVCVSVCLFLFQQDN